MTNKEAIERLKWAKLRIDNATYSPETLEALDIAIKALEEKPQAENALLMDIAHSLAIIADNSTKKGNTQESGNETLHWVHSEAHRVMCPKCGCRVSMNAAYEMNYCFKCGAKLGGIKNE